MSKINVPRGIRLFDKIADFRTWRRELLLNRQTLGYVPTMGALHKGHLDLVSAARRDCDKVALSIFVNPAQFAPNEDLTSYPRTLQADLEKLAEQGEAAVLVPRVEDIYPSGIVLDVTKQKGTFVEVQGLSHQLEGVTRPHFFRGVTTVVSKFFNIIQPDDVYFGQKDIQQCYVIQQMIRDLHIPVKMHICDTTREPDGLAMSSRNKYLSPSQRKHSVVLQKALQAMKEQYHLGERHAPTLIQTAKNIISDRQRQIKDSEDWEMRLDYVSANASHDLAEITGQIPEESGCVISLAVYLGTTRLIDNVLLNGTT